MSIHSGHRERMRQQFIQHGLDPFADHEILELLLTYAIPQRNVNPLAHELLRRFGSLEAVLSASQAELERIDGMGCYSSALLRLVPQVMRRVAQSADSQAVVLDTVERLAQYFLGLFLSQREETFYQVCLDAKGRLLSCQTLTQGNSDMVAPSIRRLVENALLCNASMVAVSHNHPSGVALPSREDTVATRQMRDALQAVGIPLVDHIIVADHDYISLRQDGLL